MNRLGKFAADNDYFSELWFGFREGVQGVGCIESSFTNLETINHMLKLESKVFSCFFEVRNTFDTVWIDGLLFKLFSESGIKGTMWLVIKDLLMSKQKYCLQGHYPGKLIFCREQDKVAPFMYKVYIDSLLKVLTDHCYAISINRLSLPSQSFADDIFLPALYPSFP